MNVVTNIHENFRMILGEISVEELVINKKLIEKVKLIHFLILNLKSGGRT